MDIWIVDLLEDTDDGTTGERILLEESEATTLIEAGSATLYWNKTMPWNHGGSE